jgi:hypothetical protein
MRQRIRRPRRRPASQAHWPHTAPTCGPLRYTLTEREGDLLQGFRTFYDVLDTAQHGATDMTERSSRKINASGFNDATTFGQALERARCGWPENTRRLQDLAASITDDIIQRVAVTEFKRSEEDGIGVDVDSYLMGEPDCLLRPYEVTPPGSESVRIVLNACVSWDVEASVLQAKGAAVVALANALERAGRRVEIIVAAAISGMGYRSHLETWFPAKQEGEPIQFDQLAFSVASADVFRRCVFACWETLPANVRQEFRIFRGGSYGAVAELRHQRGANIVVGSGSGVAWTDASSARAWVLSQLQAQGVVVAAA